MVIFWVFLFFKIFDWLGYFHSLGIELVPNSSFVPLAWLVSVGRHVEGKPGEGRSTAPATVGQCCKYNRNLGFKPKVEEYLDVTANSTSY